jgi:hypothetical protein
MEHVFRVQFGIRYDPVVREAAKNPGPWRPADSSEVFIHGILSDKRTGTCSSLPTLAIAVGRRLGYPLKLVLVPNHTLYRWDDGKEVFNLQPTAAGGEVKPDEYFHTWPRQWTQNDMRMNERTKVWLHSLSPRTEVSKFLCNRAMMLRDTKRYSEAVETVSTAERFDSMNPACADIEYSIQYGQTGGDMYAQISGKASPIIQDQKVASAQPLMKMLCVGLPAVSHEKTCGEGDVAGEPDRLINQINESKRHRSPKHLTGAPPTKPLLPQLNELLQDRKGHLR